MKTSVIGFPRVGKLRELKFVTEKVFPRESRCGRIGKNRERNPLGTVEVAERQPD